jgi:hypothetical protein
MKTGLKQFYLLNKQERLDLMNELKKVPFNELTFAEKGIVFFWFQNWTLDHWPIPKKNFISIEDLPQPKKETIASASMLDDDLPF